ncbi:MAG TPA: hypothetical protein VH598_01535, partial [Verrucomicrobiae bacterium]|nr:hypothetical protein [Verrucomicrobiae bacterium]
GGLPKGASQGAMVKSYLMAMLNFRGMHELTALALPVALLGGLSLLFQWHNERMNQFSQWPNSAKAVAVSGACAAIAVMGVFEGAQFIYFQF